VAPKSGPMMDVFPELARDEMVFFVSIPYIFISWSIALWGLFRKEK